MAFCSVSVCEYFKKKKKGIKQCVFPHCWLAWHAIGLFSPHNATLQMFKKYPAWHLNLKLSCSFCKNLSYCHFDTQTERRQAFPKDEAANSCPSNFNPSAPHNPPGWFPPALEKSSCPLCEQPALQRGSAANVVCPVHTSDLRQARIPSPG